MGAGLGSMGWDKALDYCKQVGLDAIELPVGAYPGKPFFDPAAVLESATEQQRIKDDCAKRGLEIIGLAVHGNPVSPDPVVAGEHEKDHDIGVRLAPKLGTDVVINFSGCPGGSPEDRVPNWVTCAWPPEYEKIRDYQWNDVLIPFWSKKAKAAADEGVKIAFEAHPGFSVYNTETILKIREHGARIGTSHEATKPRSHGGEGAGRGAQGAGGNLNADSNLNPEPRPLNPVDSNLGANLDPSHFFWQGIDPVESARVLGDAKCIFHVHGKDTRIDAHNTRINGTLDAKSYGDLDNRSWVFATCGYGHGDEFWKPFVSMLKMKGYDGVISIEHEDAYMSVQEGFEKAVAYLRGVMIREKAGEAWWF
jgi:sugar phosphate isomerase/epimerase